MPEQAATQPARDIWSEWLLRRRFAGNPEGFKAVRDYLYPVRDRVLEGARLEPGNVLLDVGCGDGLIAFGALERVAGVRVIFADISQDLLEHARGLAEEAGLGGRCEFVRAPAQDMAPVADASVDAVTTRAVLIYVAEKQRAFDEFYRVLRPGGRIALHEPINRFAFPEPKGRFMGYDVMPVAEIAQKVEQLFERLQPPGSDPMLDFDERDLLAYAERAGFGEIHLALEAHVRPPRHTSWEQFLHAPGNPKIPSFYEAAQQALGAEERARLMAHLRPLVESGRGRQRMAEADLWAVK